MSGQAFQLEQRLSWSGMQECFLRSSCPAAALAMRADLGHWAEALRLAPDLDPASVPSLTFRQAQVRSRA